MLKEKRVVRVTSPPNAGFESHPPHPPPAPLHTSVECAAICDLQKPKEHIDKQAINRFKRFDEVSLLSDSSIVGFIYEVLTNLQSNQRDQIFSFSSFERLGRCWVHI
jgi:hypothetical protein